MQEQRRQHLSDRFIAAKASAVSASAPVRATEAAEVTEAALLKGSVSSVSSVVSDLSFSLPPCLCVSVVNTSKERTTL